MTDEELTAIWGGSHVFPRAPFLGGVTSSAAFGTFAEPKMVGDSWSSDDFSKYWARRVAPFEKLALILRTFKPQPTDVRFIQARARDFWQFAGVTRTSSREYVPDGFYILSESDVEPLTAFSRHFTGRLPNAMQVALGRLSFAALRLAPTDQLMDAVAGMEALLLAGLDGQRVELSFRFALHYAMLEDAIDRRRHAYDTASDLYRLRSIVAHGGTPKEPVKIAGEALSLSDAAKMGIRTLRSLIERLLNCGDSYTKDAFWRDRYLGLHAHRGQPQ